MKSYRIYYRLIGATHKRTQSEIIRAVNAEAALEVFRVCNNMAVVVFIVEI